MFYVLSKYLLNEWMMLLSCIAEVLYFPFQICDYLISTPWGKILCKILLIVTFLKEVSQVLLYRVLYLLYFPLSPISWNTVVLISLFEFKHKSSLLCNLMGGSQQPSPWGKMRVNSFWVTHYSPQLRNIFWSKLLLSKISLLCSLNSMGHPLL